MHWCRWPSQRHWPTFGSGAGRAPRPCGGHCANVSNGLRECEHRANLSIDNKCPCDYKCVGDHSGTATTGNTMFLFVVSSCCCFDVVCGVCVLLLLVVYVLLCFVCLLCFVVCVSLSFVCVGCCAPPRPHATTRNNLFTTAAPRHCDCDTRH